MDIRRRNRPSTGNTINNDSGGRESSDQSGASTSSTNYGQTQDNRIVPKPRDTFLSNTLVAEYKGSILPVADAFPLRTKATDELIGSLKTVAPLTELAKDILIR